MDDENCQQVYTNAFMTHVQRGISSQDECGGHVFLLTSIQRRNSDQRGVDQSEEFPKEPEGTRHEDTEPAEEDRKMTNEEEHCCVDGFA